MVFLHLYLLEVWTKQSVNDFISFIGVLEQHVYFFFNVFRSTDRADRFWMLLSCGLTVVFGAFWWLLGYYIGLFVVIAFEVVSDTSFYGAFFQTCHIAFTMETHFEACFESRTSSRGDNHKYAPALSLSRSLNLHTSLVSSRPQVNQPPTSAAWCRAFPVQVQLDVFRVPPETICPR